MKKSFNKNDNQYVWGPSIENLIAEGYYMVMEFKQDGRKFEIYRRGNSSVCVTKDEKGNILRFSR